MYAIINKIANRDIYSETTEKCILRNMFFSSFGISCPKEEKEKRKVFAELQNESEDDDNNDDNQNNTENNSTIEDFINGAPIENTTGNNATSGGDGTGGSQRRRTVFYKEYPVVGYIKIPLSLIHI